MAEIGDYGDLDPARSVEGPGEKLPGARLDRIVRGSTDQRAQLPNERVIRQCRPIGEALVENRDRYALRIRADVVVGFERLHGHASSKTWAVRTIY